MTPFLSQAPFVWFCFVLDTEDSVMQERPLIHHLCTTIKLAENSTHRNLTFARVPMWNPHRQNWRCCWRLWLWLQRLTQSPLGVPLPTAVEGPVASSSLHRRWERRQMQLRSYKTWLKWLKTTHCWDFWFLHWPVWVQCPYINHWIRQPNTAVFWTDWKTSIDLLLNVLQYSTSE